MSSLLTHNLASIRPSEAVAVLRVPRRGPRSSGYRNVYYAGQNSDGVPVWKARVKQGRRLRHIPGSASTQPREAALHVLRWYLETFGECWRDVLRGRKRNPWQWWWSESRGKYLARVWVMGEPHEVAQLRRVRGRGDWWIPTDALEEFDTPEQAKAGIRRYVNRRYGLLGFLLVWRPLAEERSP